MKILLTITGLGSGGAQRVLVTLADAWSRRGDEVTVFTLDSFPAFYPLEPGIRRIRGGLAASSADVLDGLRANGRRIRALRKCVREMKPDVVIGFIDSTNILTVCATLGLKIPTIVCEHSDPAHLRLGAMWSTLRLLTYPMASAVTFLTANVAERWKPLLDGKAVVMPNPLAHDKRVMESDKRLFTHPYNVIAAGRLVHVKGFDLLLEAFRLVAERHDQWGLTILGEGALRPKLEYMISTFGLRDRVHLAGNVTNPFGWFRQADLFLMSSRTEGFACALCEALACGVPAIGFDCDSGPRDIIRHGVDGLLVPPLQVKELAAAMDRLMSDPAERARFAARAPEVAGRYDVEKILKRWDDLFLQVGAVSQTRHGEKLDKLGATRA